MAAVPQQDSKPELAIRHALHALGYRYVLGGRGLPGKPDLVFPKWRTVVFVHGCYWHRHPNCSRATTPVSNVEYWTNKFQENVARDQRVVESLLADHWKVAIVWECAVSRSPSELLAKEVAEFISQSAVNFLEWPEQGNS